LGYGNVHNKYGLENIAMMDIECLGAAVIRYGCGYVHGVRQYRTYVEAEAPLGRNAEGKLLVWSVAPGSIDIGFLTDWRGIAKYSTEYKGCGTR
jgi:hypothetical protein